MELLRYRSPDGEEPITAWLARLRDKTVQARLRLRLRLLQAGDWGDAKPVGGGVVELRVHVGPGYRLYCARWGPDVVLLLCGGDKSTQAQDIRTARAHWRHWKESQT